MMLSDVCLSDVCLSRTYIGSKSRTETPRKTKIDTEIAHVTRDSDTTFKVKVTRPLRLAVLAGNMDIQLLTDPDVCMMYIVSLLAGLGGDIWWRPPAYSLLKKKLAHKNVFINFTTISNQFIYNVLSVVC